MDLLSNANRYLLHLRLTRRWIREGGVVIASGNARIGGRCTFDLVETVSSGATLQITINLREVSKACKFLSDYAVYLWNCDQDGEFVLCGMPEHGSALDAPFDARSARPYRRVPPTCYAGCFPKLRLDIYEAAAYRATVPRASIVTRMLLPRGLCAAVYQNPPSDVAERANGPLASVRSPFPQTSRTIAKDA